MIDPGRHCSTASLTNKVRSKTSMCHVLQLRTTWYTKVSNTRQLKLWPVPRLFRLFDNFQGGRKDANGDESGHAADCRR